MSFERPLARKSRSNVAALRKPIASPANANAGPMNNWLIDLRRYPATVKLLGEESTCSPPVTSRRGLPPIGDLWSEDRWFILGALLLIAFSVGFEVPGLAVYAACVLILLAIKWFLIPEGWNQ